MEEINNGNLFCLIQVSEVFYPFLFSETKIQFCEKKINENTDFSKMTKKVFKMHITQSCLLKAARPQQRIP